MELRFIASIVTICAIAAATNAADTTWNGGDGDWSDETKWSNGVPDSEKSAGFSSVGGTISMGSEVRGMSSMDSMNNSSPMVWTAEAGGGLTVEGGDFCVGRVGHGILVFDSGTYTLKGDLRPGWYKQSWNTNDPAATGLVEVVNATVNYPNIYLGTDRGYGILDIKGGTVTGRYVSIGEDYHTDSNTPSYGLLKIATGGKLDLSGNNMSIGANGIGELQLNGGTIDNANYIGVGQNSTGVGRFIVNGGTVNITANLNVGNGGSGYFELGNATVSPSGFYIGGALGKMGEAVVKSGGVLHNRSNDIELGRYGQGTLTITGGGSVYTLYWLKLCVNGSNTEDATLNLEDGGVYTGGSIGKGSGTGNAIVNFNGGILRQEADANGYQTLIQSNMGDVNVMRKGMIVDTALRNNDAYGNISGVGFLEKRGDYTLWVKNAVDLKRGVRVVGGTLTLEQGFVTETTATTPVKEIYVAEGKSLDLKGNLAEKPTIYVESYTRNGVAQAPGEYDDYNATIIVIAGGNTVATATWTNADGDNDLTNPDNWNCYNADGVLLFDALPSVTSIVTAPYSYAALFEGFTAAEIIFTAAGEIALDAAGDDYGFPSTLAATGDLKIQSGLNKTLFRADAWYDPSDISTLMLDGNGGVTNSANEGHRGTAMDGEAGKGDAQTWPKLSEADDSSMNGLRHLVFDNVWGFTSKGYLESTATQPRALFVVSQRKDTAYVENEETKHAYEMHPLEFHGGPSHKWSGNGKFKLERYGWSAEGSYKLYKTASSEALDHYVQGGFNNDEDRSSVLDMIADGVKLAAHSYEYADGVYTLKSSDDNHDIDEGKGETKGTMEYDHLDISDEGKMYVNYGQRFDGPASSSGRLGESLAFTTALTDGEADMIRRYLGQKWLGSETSTISTTEIGSLILDNSATVDFDGANVAITNLYGSGTISNGTVTAIGTLNIVVNSDGTANKIVIPNGLNVAGMKVNISGIGNLKQGQPVIVLEAATGALGGKIEPADVTIDVEGFRYRLKVNADGKLELAKSSGFMMILR